MRYILVLCIVI